MAEEVKKVPKPVDPNSAKYKLGKIAADAYVDAIEAKKRGEKVAWVSSNFPVEIPETMGIATVYPENQAAGIAARGAGTRMCEVAESEGYSNDICAYARVSLAYAKLKSCPEQDVAMPDVLLCCSNICSCMIKWYENLARELNIPMILLDIPFNPDYEVSDAEVAYVTGQFWDAVKQLDEGFSEMLLRKIGESGMTDAQCYKRANIDRRLFSKIKNDKHYTPSKSTVIAFGLALELPMEELRELLGKGGAVGRKLDFLTHASEFDIIVEYFVTQGIYNVFTINEALFAFDQNLIGV